jgi:hypothetical protein
VVIFFDRGRVSGGGWGKHRPIFWREDGIYEVEIVDYH